MFEMFGGFVRCGHCILREVVLIVVDVYFVSLDGFVEDWMKCFVEENVLVCFK